MDTKESDSVDAPAAPNGLLEQDFKGLDPKARFFSSAGQTSITADMWQCINDRIWEGKNPHNLNHTWKDIARNNPALIKDFWGQRHVTAMQLIYQVLELSQTRPKSNGEHKSIDRELKVKQQMLAKVLPEIFGDVTPALSHGGTPAGKQPLVSIEVNSANVPRGTLQPADITVSNK